MLGASVSRFKNEGPMHCLLIFPSRRGQRGQGAFRPRFPLGTLLLGTAVTGDPLSALCPQVGTGRTSCAIRWRSATAWGGILKGEQAGRALAGSSATCQLESGLKPEPASCTCLCGLRKCSVCVQERGLFFLAPAPTYHTGHVTLRAWQGIGS